MLIKSPKISVVMPTYNAETHLSMAIDSILAQTFDDFEFLIIDDNSSDRTREIIEAYNDKRIRLIDGCCKGLAVALNQGIREARGIYIARMDSDDVSLPIRFEKQFAYMDMHRDITVLGAWQEHFSENEAKIYIHAPFAKNEELMISFAFEPSVCHSTVMLRRCDIIENKFFYPENSPCEDGELWMRVIKTHKFATVQQILGKYLLSEGSITEKKKKIISEYETTLRQNYLRDMFGYVLKDEDKYLLNIWEYRFKNMSHKQIYSAVIRLEKILKEMELAINKKHILSASRVHEIMDFFYLKMSEKYHKVKKICYKPFGMIVLMEVIQIGDMISVYLFKHIKILGIIKCKTKSNKIIIREIATKILETMLCIKNERRHKVIIILGLKIKIKSRYLQQKQELSQQKQELSQQKQELSQQKRELSQQKQELSQQKQELSQYKENSKRRFDLKKWIEFTLDVGCPNNCEYCPQDVFIKKYYEGDENRKSTMTLDDFKIFLKNIPKDVGINFAGFSEPFKNTQAVDMMEHAINQGYEVHVYSTLRGLAKENIMRLKYMPISSFVVHLPDKDGLMKFSIDDDYLCNLELFYSLGLPNTNFMVIGKLHDKINSIIKKTVWMSPIITRGKNLHNKDVLKRVDSWCNEDVSISQNTKIICNRRFYNKRIIGVAPTHAESSILLPDGTMVLCCADWDMRHKLGNLYNNTYEEIMNGPIMSRIENSMMCKNDDRIICRDCEWAVKWDKNKWENFVKTGNEWV